MISFILGFIVGCIGCCIVFIGFIYLDRQQKNPLKKVEQAIRAITAPKGAIIYPKSEGIREFEEMIARNDEKGLDSDLGGLI